MHEAKITLKDEHGNTNQYILVFEITSSIPYKPKGNNLPYFKEKDWNDKLPVQLTKYGGEVVFKFPEPYDDDGDKVSIELDMSKWRSFAKYKKESRKVVFKLEDELKLGLQSAKVKLSDGKGESKY